MHSRKLEKACKETDMRSKVGGLLGFALMASSALAASEPLSVLGDPSGAVPVAEVSPEELGALVSAIAFVDACLSLRDVSHEMDGATPVEIALFQVAGELCRGMVVAVASTVQAGQPYRAGGEGVCVDPVLSPEKVINHMKGQIVMDPQPFMGRPTPQIETPAAILRSISALSPCK